MTERQALVVEDDAASAEAYCRVMASMGFVPTRVSTFQAAKDSLGESSFELVLLDLGLPDGDGLDILTQYATGANRPPRFIVITGNQSQSAAVDSFRANAVDFLSKPVSLDQLKRSLSKPFINAAMDASASSEPSNATPGYSVVPSRETTLVLEGHSQAAQELRAKAARIAMTTNSCLIYGEPGTDKAGLAVAIHRLSKRTGQFLYAHASLFAKAETSASSADVAQLRTDIAQLLEAGAGGTVFIDDITKLGQVAQSVFAEVLNEQAANTHSKGEPNAQLILSIPVHWQVAIDDGTLDSESFHTLAVIRIDVPALRERRSDITAMAELSVTQLNKRHGMRKSLDTIDDDLIENYLWPGNLTELENAVAQSFFGATASVCIDAQRLALSSSVAEQRKSLNSLVGKTFREVENHLMLLTLDAVHGDKAKAAETLGISLKTLYNRLNALPE